ncbi:MAG: FtsW/RodA/SpoVE family cell cycle protein [Lactobacillaceae bacterium]|nr:FtsW/RodA/SpoVE family cell cycle protein [Lactobacillaceae bacterium]
MISKIKQWFSQIDKQVLIAVLALSFIGILAVSSASQTFAGGALFYFIRQFIFILLGIFLVIFITVLPDSYKMMSNKKLILILSGILLALLLYARFAGTVAQGTGAYGWIQLIAGFTIQPAEFAKIMVILVVASYYLDRLNAKNQDLSKKWNSLDWPTFLIPAVFIGLIISMPDLGNAIIVTFIFLVVYLSSGIKPLLTYFVSGATVVLTILLPFIVRALPSSLLKSNYQLMRFVVFENPWPYYNSQGLQVVRSLLAISRGGLFGQGAGQSVVKSTLPVSNTDFIMAVIGEEFGLLGILVILSLYFWLVFRIFYVSVNSKSLFNRIVLNGIGGYFFIQALVNLGGITALLPMTGVTFPFISYGGTSLLVSFIAIGIVLKIFAEEKTNQ